MTFKALDIKNGSPSQLIWSCRNGTKKIPNLYFNQLGKAYQWCEGIVLKSRFCYCTHALLTPMPWKWNWTANISGFKTGNEILLNTMTRFLVVTGALSQRRWLTRYIYLNYWIVQSVSCKVIYPPWGGKWRVSSLVASTTSNGVTESGTLRSGRITRCVPRRRSRVLGEIKKLSFGVTRNNTMPK